MCGLLGGGGGLDVLGFWGLGGRGACSKCTLRRQEGMISQRCSSPQHLAMMPRCWSSRGIQVCCTSSSQVMLVSYLSKSNKDMYCIEILYKYDHGLFNITAYQPPVTSNTAHLLSTTISSCKNIYDWTQHTPQIKNLTTMHYAIYKWIWTNSLYFQILIIISLYDHIPILCWSSLFLSTI